MQAGLRKSACAAARPVYHFAFFDFWRPSRDHATAPHRIAQIPHSAANARPDRRRRSDRCYRAESAGL